MSKNSSLTTGEQKKLAELESTIETGMKSFIDVGHALMAIRDRKLYTDVHETFEGYCKQRWEFSASRARQLIGATNAAKVIQSVTTGNTLNPPNERVARELAAVDGERQQADVWAKAVESAPKDKATGKPKVTAAHVKKVRGELLGEKEPEPAKPAKPAEDTVDKDGCSDLSTEEAMADWNRKVEAWARSINGCFSAAPVGPWLDDSRRDIVENQLKSAAASARQAKCDKVCPLCAGEGCKRCLKTGFMPNRNYEMAGGK